MAAWDVLGLGCAAVDDLLYISAYPPPDVKVRVRRRERQCGGLTATALVAAARLGARCAYGGVLGDDEDSRFVEDCLRREGVDVSPVVRRAGARPIHSFIVVDETNHTRNIFFDLAGSTGADPEQPGADVIRSAKILYVDHYGVEGMTRAARIAQAAGVAVAADLERDEWPGFDDLLALVDHLIVNQAFAHKRTGAGDPAQAVDRLWSEARRAVVVTCGTDGCWYRGEGEARPQQQAAFRVETADTTGCGDVFHGAYLAALARDKPLAERVRFASAAAALKAKRYGAQAGIPTREEVEAFLA
jgi:sugar/nucleoside kinase (ribokinase family)